MADALATLASMIVVKYWNEVPNITVMRLDRPAHVFAVEEYYGIGRMHRSKDQAS